MKIKVKRGQCLLDIALYYTGSVLSVYAIAQANNIAISDDISGMELEIPDDVDTEKKVINKFVSYKVNPATAIETDTITDADGNETPIMLEGIGYWTIKGTFIVS